MTDFAPLFHKPPDVEDFIRRFQTRFAADLPRGAGAGSAFVLTLTLPPWRKDAARESGVARARAGAMSPTEDDDARVLLAADGLAVTAARACLSIVVRVSAILQSS